MDKAELLDLTTELTILPSKLALLKDKLKEHTTAIQTFPNSSYLEDTITHTNINIIMILNEINQITLLQEQLSKDIAVREGEVIKLLSLLDNPDLKTASQFNQVNTSTSASDSQLLTISTRMLLGEFFIPSYPDRAEPVILSKKILFISIFLASIFFSIFLACILETSPQ